MRGVLPGVRSRQRARQAYGRSPNHDIPAGDHRRPGGPDRRQYRQFRPVLVRQGPGAQSWPPGAERTLLLTALFGGIGAWLGQQVLRHKTRKQPFGSWLGLVLVLHGLLVVTGLAVLILR